MNKRVAKAFRAGILRGWSGYVWLLKILVPISFATALLIWSGWLYKLDFLIQPVMGLLSLPAAAALPLIIGLFTGIYGAVAAMAAMPLTMEQMTLIAIFLLISHNLVQESIIQGQSGLNSLAAACFRLLTSFAVTCADSRVMDVADPVILTATAGASAGDLPPFGPMFLSWGRDIAGLCMQIFAIIMPLMVVLETMKEFDLIRYIVGAATPVFSLLGLSRATGMLWLTAALFGLSYGAAVIVEETRTNDFSKDELTRLQLSIGINHAMIEDPALFLPLGISPLWLWIPRLLAAIAAIYLFHLVTFFRRLNAQRTGHKKICDHR
ncbi:MAG: iron transporter [Desulfobacteraceae bacterium]|nr:iron transporter [Desulfobacteraceae bacterium]